MLLMPEREHADARSVSPGSAEHLLALVLIALGFENESSTTYQSGETLVCFGTQFHIRVYPGGRVTYRHIDTEGQQVDDQTVNLSNGELIEKARVIVADSIGKTCGSADAAFESFESEGNYASVYFGYHLAGGRVCLNEEVFAARVNFSFGAMTEVELNFRSYTFTGDFTRLLPEKQALAAAGGEFLLCYSSTGAEVLQPAFVKYGF